MFHQRESAARPFAEAGSQSGNSQLQRLAYHVGLAEFRFRGRCGKVPGQSGGARNWNRVVMFHREIITYFAANSSVWFSGHVGPQIA